MKCVKPFVRIPDGVSSYAKAISSEALIMSSPFNCGQCVPCKIMKRMEWVHRIDLELMCNQDNCFITLTYDDDNLPIVFNDDGSTDANLEPRDLTLFMKRLRKRIGKRKIRFFAVGEYGDRSQRPHYHLIIFGLSHTFENLINGCWKNGFTYTKECDAGSSRYIAGYVTKKLNSRNNELGKRYPEFMRSSRQDGGIGIQQIKKIARILKASKDWDGKIIRTLGAKKVRPLGRYLTNKLAQELGISELQLYRDYVQRAYELHQDIEKEPGETWINKVENYQVQQRDNIIGKQKIKEHRRPI